MTNQQHPITPPPEFVYKLAQERVLLNDPTPLPEYIATRAAQWSADQELEACCEWTAANFGKLPGQNLHLYRRPKPPTLKELKEQALAAAARFYAKGHEDCTEQEVRDDYDALCRALGALPND